MILQLPAKANEVAVKELRAGMEAFATQVFRSFRDGKKLTPIVHTSLKNLFKYGAQLHVDTCQDILNLARSGDQLADEAMCELYREMKYSNQQPPVIGGLR
jgi:hypothetical protein